MHKGDSCKAYVEISDYFEAIFIIFNYATTCTSINTQQAVPQTINLRLELKWDKLK